VTGPALVALLRRVPACVDLALQPLGFVGGSGGARLTERMTLADGRGLTQTDERQLTIRGKRSSPFFFEQRI
jgi:hypothetical protein